MDDVIVTPAQMGSVLAAGRRRAGLTQAEAAVRLGISQSRISTLERSTGALTMDQLLTMLATYGLELTVKDRVNPYELPEKEAQW